MNIKHILKHKITKSMIDTGGSPAIYAKGAYERAGVFLRMLAGDSNWFDQYSRTMCDIFEMNDADEVVGWILKFYNESEEIRSLCDNHSDRNQFLFLPLACEAGTMARQP
jgi:hypothetical protein